MEPVLFTDAERLANANWNLRFERDLVNFQPVSNALTKEIRSRLSGPEGKSLLPDGKARKLLRITEPSLSSSWAVLKASVLEARADAIVNAANPTLLGGGGVDGAIHRAAGPELKAACARLGGCQPGEAKVTGAFNLANTRAIIHTVGPVFKSLEKDTPTLKSAYASSLNAARLLGCESVAFPCISAGAYGFPLAQAARAALETVFSWQAANADYVLDVYFCCFTEAEYSTYLGEIKVIQAESKA